MIYYAKNEANIQCSKKSVMQTLITTLIFKIKRITITKISGTEI